MASANTSATDKTLMPGKILSLSTGIVLVTTISLNRLSCKDYSNLSFAGPANTG